MDLGIDLGQDVPLLGDDSRPDSARESGTTGIDARAAAVRDSGQGEAASPTSVLDASYAAYSDFEGGNALGWSVMSWQDSGLDNADWTVIANSAGLVYSQGSLDTTGWHISYDTTSVGNDQIIEATLRAVDFQADNVSYMVALFGRYDATTDSGYLLALRGDGSVIVSKRTQGKNASWDAGNDIGLQAGIWYQVRLEIIGGAINAFINDQAVYSVVDSSPLSGGGLALGSYGATLEVDRVWLVNP